MKYSSIILLILFWNQNIFSSDIEESLSILKPIKIEPKNYEIALGSLVVYCEDVNNEFLPEKILNDKSDFNKCFQESNQEKPNFGYTKSTYWIKFSLFNPKDSKIQPVLKLVSLIDHIEIFRINRNTIEREFFTGRVHPLSTRATPHRNFVFRLQSKPNEITTYLIRFRSEGSMLLPLYLFSEDRYAETDHSEALLFGFYFGIMAVMVLYNLFLFFSIRDKSYIYYCAYIVFFLLLQAGLWGFMNQFFFPEVPYIANRSLPISIILAVFFVVLFFRYVLNTKEVLPLADKIFKGIQWFSLSFSIFAIFGTYRTVIQIGIIVSMITAILLLYVSAYAFFKGIKQARFLFFAFTALVLGILVIGLRNFGILPFNIATSYSAQIGSALEVILLSLSLGDRINIMKKEREKEREAIILKERKMNQSFSRFVPKEFLQFLGHEDISKVKLGDVIEKNMTILFSDIRSFTTISERLSPQDNFRFLNSYLKTIGPVIRKNNGFIDKYIGDAIMALFPYQPEDALRAAESMIRQLKRFNRIPEGRGFDPIRIGIGIHYGSLMLGTIGETRRMDTTVISDAVNVASRIEGLTKNSDSNVLISGEVIKLLPQPLDPRLQFKEFSTIKGRSNPVGIWEFRV